jgi:hypothetical protein
MLNKMSLFIRWNFNALINKWLRVGLTAFSILLSIFGVLVIIMSFSETHSITDVKNTLTLQQLDFMQSYAGFFPIGLGSLNLFYYSIRHLIFRRKAMG